MIMEKDSLSIYLYPSNWSIRYRWRRNARHSDRNHNALVKADEVLIVISPRKHPRRTISVSLTSECHVEIPIAANPLLSAQVEGLESECCLTCQRSFITIKQYFRCFRSITTRYDITQIIKQIAGIEMGRMCGVIYYISRSATRRNFCQRFYKKRF